MLLDFKGRAQAEAWKSDLRELNDQTKIVLEDVAKCIKEIQLESVGDPVDQLVVTAADMAASAVKVIDGLRGLEDAIQSIIQLFIQIVSEAAQNVADNRMESTNF